MHPGRPVVIGAQPQAEAQAKLQACADELSCPVTRTETAVTIKADAIQYQDRSWGQKVHITVADHLDSGAEWQHGWLPAVSRQFQFRSFCVKLDSAVLNASLCSRGCMTSHAPAAFRGEL